MFGELPFFIAALFIFFHAIVLAKLAVEKHEREMEFSDKGIAELDEIHGLITAKVEDTVHLISEKDGFRIEKIHAHEEAIDAKVCEARGRILERFRRRIYRAEAGPIFLEMLINLERISDHCQNIAECVKAP